MKKVKLAVNGTLMRGFPLNHNLLDAGAIFLRETKTAPSYRLWSIDEAYPAMLRDDDAGSPITVEIWELTADALVAVLVQEPPGLCLGRVELEDGEIILGILSEPFLYKGHPEITRWGGWREYRHQKAGGHC